MKRGDKKSQLTFTVQETTELLPFLMNAMHGISRNRAKALLVNRLVLVDNIITTNALTTLHPGQTVQLDRSKQKMAFHSNDLGVVYEDPYLLVIDKRAGLLSMSNNTRQQTVQNVHSSEQMHHLQYHKRYPSYHLNYLKHWQTSNQQKYRSNNHRP